MQKSELGYWKQRLHEETAAALDSNDAHVAAVHVQLAQGYARRLVEQRQAETQA